MFFSLVMTSFNRADLLERAVQSVLRQTYKHFELIIVDDCSSDHSPEIILSLQREDPRIIPLLLEKNLGVSGARNEGFRRGSAPFFAFLDDDDETLPDWLSSFHQRIPSLPDTWGVLYSRYLMKEELTGVIYPNVVPSREGSIFENLMRGDHLPIGTPGAIVKREALESVGGYDEKMSGLEDYDLWFRLARDWTFHFVNRPSILVYEHSGSRLSGDVETNWEVREHFLNKWRTEMVRFGGEFVPHEKERKEKAGRFFARIRRETYTKGRLAGLGLLWRSTSRENFLPLYFLKDLFQILIGPTLYDHLRRIRGNLYWQFYKCPDNKG